MLRAACVAVVVSVSGSAVAADAGGAGDAGAPDASMTCEHAAAPGRVRCAVEARVGTGDAIDWGDVILISTPPFVAPLRGRIGPHDATQRDPGVWRWALALVARSKGSGTVEGRVRLVVCRRGVCTPHEVPVSVRVDVGD